MATPTYRQIITRREALAALLGCAAGASHEVLAESWFPSRPNFQSWESLIDPKTFSIRVSQQVLQAFAADFDTKEEDIYILLAGIKSGVIEKICSRHCERGASWCGFEEGFLSYLDRIARKHGYFVPGYYHSHPSPRGNGHAGDLLSPDDLPSSFPGCALRLLSHGSATVPFTTRAYLPLTAGALGNGHPYLRRSAEFTAHGLSPRSRYGGEAQSGSIELKLEPLAVEASPSFDEILSRYPSFSHSCIIFLSNDRYRNLGRLLLPGLNPAWGEPPQGPSDEARKMISPEMLRKMDEQLEERRKQEKYLMRFYVRHDRFVMVSLGREHSRLGRSWDIHKELSSGRMSELMEGKPTPAERERVTLLYRTLQELLKEGGDPFLTALRLDVNPR